MLRSLLWVLTLASFPACGQMDLYLHGGDRPASPGWPFGPPHNRVTLRGFLAHSDGETLSLLLEDARVIRFRLLDETRYEPDGGSGKLSDFRAADFVEVQARVDAKGYLEARGVRFLRIAAAGERARVAECPEREQRWRASVLDPAGLDGIADERRLDLVAKSAPIAEPAALPALDSSEIAAAGPGSTIALARERGREAFESLPTFRARQVTSMFHSFSKPIKWIPDDVVSAEIGYEEDQEYYSDLRINGRRPSDASETVSPDFMRSLDKAWSTGDFKTITHCVFSELEDEDFRQSGTATARNGDVLIYDFARSGPSACIALKFKSEVAYPGYKGRLHVDSRGDVLRVEIEAAGIPAAFPLDRAERSAEFGAVRIGEAQYRMPLTGYWFGCFRNSYSCFLNRLDFRDYRRFEASSTVRFTR